MGDISEGVADTLYPANKKKKKKNLVWEGGDKVREKVEGQQYTSLFLRPWGQQFTSWVENTNNE
jgi:hypothetical protein